MADVKPWEMQPEETMKAYEAFCVYRDLGPSRSMRETAEKLGKSQGLMEGWSVKHEWGKRAAAWDAEQDRINRQEQMKEIAKMRKRHADIAKKALDKVEAAIDSIDEHEMSNVDIARLMAEAAKLERLSRGDVGDVIEERDGGEAISAVQIYIPDNSRGRGNDNYDDLEV